MTESGETQSLTVPRRRQVAVGTLRTIVRQATRYVPGEQLAPYFYSDWR
ncbi:MAG: hypothetical protein WD848_13370 [Dehalococcoidia bacterium]